MENAGFVIAAWGVILGGMSLYALTLLRRLAAARRSSLQIRRDAESVTAPPPDRTA